MTIGRKRLQLSRVAVGLPSRRELLLPFVREQLHGLTAEFLLLGGRKSAERGQVDRIDLSAGVGTRFAAHPLREVARELLDHCVIEQMKRLRSNRRITALDAVGVHLREVKGLQVRWELLPPLLHIDEPSPASCGTDWCHEPIAAHLHGIGGAAARLVEPARDEQQRVVERFRVEPHERHPRVAARSPDRVSPILA